MKRKGMHRKFLLTNVLKEFASKMWEIRLERQNYYIKINFRIKNH
jgi:hypothetical protein